MNETKPKFATINTQPTKTNESFIAENNNGLGSTILISTQNQNANGVKNEDEEAEYDSDLDVFVSNIKLIICIRRKQIKKSKQR